MPLNTLDDEIDHLADELARRTHLTKTDAVRQALRNELDRMNQTAPLWERVRPIQDRILARPSTGLAADKAFYDDLSGNP